MNTKFTNRKMYDGEMRLNRLIYIIFSNILQLYLFFKNYLFSLQSKIYREEERQKGIGCVLWFTPQVTTPAGAAPIQSKEPGTCSTLKGFGLSSTAVPGHKQGAGWAGSGAAGIRTKSHMGSWCYQGKNISHWTNSPGQICILQTEMN